MKNFADTIEAISQAVTEGYQRLESGIVGGFTRVSDKCVETLFAKSGETAAQAKERLRKN